MNYAISYVGYPSVLECYPDASWINDVEDSSSTSAWVFLLGGEAEFNVESSWIEIGTHVFIFPGAHGTMRRGSSRGRKREMNHNPNGVFGCRDVIPSPNGLGKRDTTARDIVPCGVKQEDEEEEKRGRRRG
nr:zinc finger, CCHC-type [Tanacetum cinerariifolium]